MLVVFVAAQVVLFLRPPSRVPKHADAVVSFSGDRGERLARSLALVRKGVAPVLVLANGDTTEWPTQTHDLCTTPQPFEVLCPRSGRPYNTQAEARMLGRLASQRGWRHVIVVTSNFHLTRARLLFDRCYAGAVSQVSAIPPERVVKPRVVAHEWAGVAWALVVDRSC